MKRLGYPGTDPGLVDQPHTARKRTGQKLCKLHLHPLPAHMNQIGSNVFNSLIGSFLDIKAQLSRKTDGAEDTQSILRKPLSGRAYTADHAMLQILLLQTRPPNLSLCYTPWH